jgi:hypothetical protein
MRIPYLRSPVILIIPASAALWAITIKQEDVGNRIDNGDWITLDLRDFTSP